MILEQKIKAIAVKKAAVLSLVGILGASVFSYGCTEDTVEEHKTDTYHGEDSYVPKDAFQSEDTKLLDTKQPEKYCEFKCDNGKLIPQEWACDGKYDCCEDEDPYYCDVFEDEGVETCGEECSLSWPNTWNNHKWHNNNGGCCTEGWNLSACINSFTDVDALEYEPTALTFDGKYLWLSTHDYLPSGMSKNAKIFKIGSNFGEILDSFDSPDEFIPGLAWDGQHLWCSGYHTCLVS